jgi:hypothetical protein
MAFGVIDNLKNSSLSRLRSRRILERVWLRNELNSSCFQNSHRQNNFKNTDHRKPDERGHHFQGCKIRFS